MKITLRAITTSVFSLLAVAILCSGIGGGNDGDMHVQNKGGIASSSGGPGEHTCSDVNCHGAGNGGLPDNGGPGSVTITTIPTLNFNQYIPNTTYTVAVTVAQAGCNLFGFDGEVIDNSGTTDLHINNTAGTVTLIDPTRTKIMQPYGTGRKIVTHLLNAGASANSSTFYFKWVAPASGTVNMYASGLAANGDNLENAPDNCYLTNKLTITPGATGITEASNSSGVSVFPNPITSVANIHVDGGNNNGTFELYDLAGNKVRAFPLEGINTMFSRKDLSGGLYFYKVSSQGGQIVTGKIVVR